MGVLKHKIWYDIWHNKSRSLQIILIIAMGAAAIGMIAGVREMIIPNMQGSWQAINPAMINLAVFPAVDDDDLIALSKIEGVSEIEGFNSATIEWRVNPEDEWVSGGLIARSDYDNQTLNKLELATGDWPHDRIFVIEQGHAEHFQIPNGELTMRINGREYPVKVEGAVYNQLLAPVSFGGTLQLYTTRERYEEITGSRNYNQVVARAAEFDEELVTGIADDIQNKLEKQGKDSFEVFPGRVVDPGKHFFQDSLDGLFFLMGVLSILALILGLLLVYNTINALITQQIDQIGIMKAIGAKTSQIFGLFMSNILVYSLLSLLVAVPLGVWGAWSIVSWLVGSFNADPGTFMYSPSAIVAMVVVALIAPLLASILPIINGSRITVREAINTYGLSDGGGLIDRLLANAQRISRMVLVTISNTFRHKWRVALTQITLIMSGLIFMMVIGVRDSVVYTISDVLLGILNYDINYVFDDAERISYVEEITLDYPGVKAAEMWGFGGGNVRLQGLEESEDDEGVTMFGVPLPTQLYSYQLREGRWLIPEDTHAVVLNQDLAEDAGVGVGDWITVQHDSKTESSWQVVGLLFDPFITSSAHVPRQTLLSELDQVGKAATVWIQTDESVTDKPLMARNMRLYYDAMNAPIAPQRGVFGIADTARETGETFINQFNFIVVLLAIMAVIVGVVGSIALSGALSLSVIERRREIGVMRAIGASSWAIFRLFIGEGLILGWLSWLIALPLSIPAGQAMVAGVGAAFQLDLIYHYTPVGSLLWLAIITVLSIFASILPARGATRISVRESLAYL